MTGIEQRWEPICHALVGKPFEWGARGPIAYDCWGLVAEALHRAGFTVPGHWMADDTNAASAIMESEVASGRWQPVSDPGPGAVCAMSLLADIHHVGVVTPWGVLHVFEGAHGAVLSSEGVLRALGYQRIEYYRWAG